MRNLIVNLTFICGFFIGMVSCNDNYMPDSTESIVVEGWIDAGRFPVVILTRSLPLRLIDDAISMDKLSDYVVRWAKVTVSDGETEVVLTGGNDEDYYPPFIYTTGEMRGVAGKTYYLKIETDNEVITATTTIPKEVPQIDSVVCSRLDEDESLFRINVYVKDNPQTRNYYKSFYLTNLEKNHFLSSYLGVVDGALVDGAFVMQIIRGDNIAEEPVPSSYFEEGTDVVLKIATMDNVSYNIWQGYEDKTRLGFSYLTSSTTNVPTNINGGIGLWCGYNAVCSSFKIKPQTITLGN